MKILLKTKSIILGLGIISSILSCQKEDSFESLDKIDNINMTSNSNQGNDIGEEKMLSKDAYIKILEHHDGFVDEIEAKSLAKKMKTSAKSSIQNKPWKNQNPKIRRLKSEDLTGGLPALFRWNNNNSQLDGIPKYSRRHEFYYRQFIPISDLYYPGAGSFRRVRSLTHSNGGYYDSNSGNSMFTRFVQKPYHKKLNPLKIKSEILDVYDRNSEYTITPLGDHRPLTNDTNRSENSLDMINANDFLYELNTTVETNVSETKNIEHNLGVSIEAPIFETKSNSNIAYGYSNSVSNTIGSSTSETIADVVNFPSLRIPPNCECRFKPFVIKDKEMARVKIFTSLEGPIVTTRSIGVGLSKTETKKWDNGANILNPKVSFTRDGRTVKEHGILADIYHTKTDRFIDVGYECINSRSGVIYRRKMPQGYSISWRDKSNARYKHPNKYNYSYGYRVTIN